MNWKEQSRSAPIDTMVSQVPYCAIKGTDGFDATVPPLRYFHRDGHARATRHWGSMAEHYHRRCGALHVDRGRWSPLSLPWPSFGESTLSTDSA
jgi:hypothetical protein